MAVSGAASAASVHASIANVRSTSGCSREMSVRQALERRQHLRRIRLARDDPPVDDELAAIGDDVGGVPPRDDRGVRARTPDERVLAIGEHLRQAQHEPGHRRDRVDPEVGLGAVGARALRGGDDPRAAALGQPDAEVARLADDARVLDEQAAVEQDLGAVQAHVLLVGGQVERQACPPSSTPARRIAAAAASADATGPFMSAEPRPISLPSSTAPSHGPCPQFAGRPRARRRGGRSTRGTAAPRSRSTPPRSAVAPRAGSSRARPIAARMPAATAAASSSVPPGFSLGAATSARANARTSSASTADGGRLRDRRLYHGDRLYP